MPGTRIKKGKNWKRLINQFNNLIQEDIDPIDYAAGVIRGGGLVAFPTETVYGLGANALNPLAVAKIFQLKERPNFDPLIVHISSYHDLKKLTINVSENVMLLARKFWPGPLTIILPKSNLIPDIVTSGLPTVGIRMPDNEMALELIMKSECPIAAPSANKFGQLSPTKAKHVRKQLPDVDFILDGGKTAVGIESTIVTVQGNVCSILRPGKITMDDINMALPGLFEFKAPELGTIVAPGLLKSHYSPKKPLHILASPSGRLPEKSGLILHADKDLKVDAVRTIYTSNSFNMLEVAANLFSALHSLEDDPEIDLIFIEHVPEKGLGIAVMDRIKKAAYRYTGE